MFKVGDRVRLSKKSPYAHQNDGMGVITEDDTSRCLNLRVKWDKAKRGEQKINVYDGNDLVLVKRFVLPYANAI